MEITLNNIEYTAPGPMTGLWFAISKMKTEHAKRIEEIQVIWKQIQPFEGIGELAENDQLKLENLITSCNKKTEINQKILIDGKIKVIVDTFKNSAITQETILEHLPLQDVDVIFARIDKWLNDIIAGRMEQLPNE